MASLQVENQSKKPSANRFKLPLCCDSVEWCRYADFENIIGVGHYELVSKDQTKIGGITLFQQTNPSSDVAASGLITSQFHQLSFTKTAPILDLKWHSMSSIGIEEKQNDESSIYLSAATCNGTIDLYALTQTKEKILGLELKYQHQIPSNQDSAPPICLSLDWNSVNRNLCTTSCSDGSIVVLQFDGNESSMISRIEGHSDQVWTTSFDRYSADTVYSGADDCVFAVWDLRQSEGDKVIVHRDDSTHKMGICSITDSYSDPNLLLTGSYDEYLRIWDKRKWNEPIDALKFEDGVWRIKWCPNEGNRDKILIGTMRDHFNVCRFDGETQKLVKLY